MKQAKMKATPAGFGNVVPPLREHVEIYFMQKGCNCGDAAFFFSHQQKRNWRTSSGKPARNWKTLACDWIWEMKYGSK